MTRSVEIPEAAQERVTGILHEFEHGRLNSVCPGVDDCQLWYDAEIRTAYLLRALPYLAPAEHNHPQVCCCPDINAYPCPETCPACFKHGRSLPYFTPAGDGALRHALEQLANIWAAPDAPTVGIRVAAHMLREVLAVHPAAAQPAGDVCSACGSGILQPVITREHIRDDLPPCFGSPAVPQPVDREALLYVLTKWDVGGWKYEDAEGYRERVCNSLLALLAGEQEQVEK